MLRWIVLFLFVSISSLVHADVPPHFVGTWTLSWEMLGKYGNTRLSAHLEVPASGSGKFLGFGSSKTNNCLSNEAPVTVKVVSDDVIVVVAKLSDVLEGCPNQVFRLKRTEDGLVLGFLNKGDQQSITVTVKRES